MQNSFVFVNLASKIGQRRRLSRNRLGRLLSVPGCDHELAQQTMDRTGSWSFAHCSRVHRSISTEYLSMFRPLLIAPKDGGNCTELPKTTLLQAHRKTTETKKRPSNKANCSWLSTICLLLHLKYITLNFAHFARSMGRRNPKKSAQSSHTLLDPPVVCAVREQDEPGRRG